ncbi:MAG TPA: glycosyltransferase family 2 protein [Thermoanaerobaculia bacterium]|nr:glycosyltransferase family 2 protein [Thermoanaerobaculia bacterium]
MDLAPAPEPATAAWRGGPTPLLSVIVVTWNSAEVLPRCLDALRRQTLTSRELIVVDNGSADDSVAIAERHEARLICNETNRGFAAAVNQGIAAARGELIQLLNPDCFLHPEYCARLAASLGLAGSEFGMATGKLLSAERPSLIDSKGIAMTRSGRHLDIDQGLPDDEDDADAEVFGVSGAAAMYRRSFLEDVSIDGEVFDEDFFSYREDADLSWRGRLFGWRALYAADAVAHHVRRVTPERRRDLPPLINLHSVKNRFLLRLKNEGWRLALRNAPFEISRDAVTIAAVLTVERTSLPALAWLWRHRSRILAKRRAIQARRRVSDRTLARWFR